MQSLACVDAWAIDPDIVNTRGGAIAIGHPLGASGARILGTLAQVLRRAGERWGVAAICIGVGQGLAVVLENVGHRAVTTTITDADAAVADIPDGATVLIGGFGTAGQPVELIDALIGSGAGDLTIVSNNAGNGDTGLAALLAAGRVRKMICSFPRQADSWVFDELYRAGQDRARAGAAGQPRRADARRRRRHRRVLHTDRGRHAAGRGQGDPHHRRPRLRARVPDPRRRRADPGATGPTGWATSSTARPPATSARSWRPPRRSRSPRSRGRARSASTRRRRDPGHLRRPAWCRHRSGQPATTSSTPTTAPGCDRDELAARRRRATSPTASYVNLGIGQPTRVADYLPAGSGVTLHTENGMLGMGPRGRRRRDRPRPDQRGQAPGHRAARAPRTSTTPTRSR